ncbi:Karyopherin transporter [Coemansia sp. RSA 25]|nr:Karyopherin transporter [Coemansia sp. RSA 25]
MAVAGLREILGDLSKIDEEWDDYDNEQQEFVQNVAMFLTSFLASHLRLVESSATRETVIQAHQYLLRISQVDEREMFKVCLEYWNVLVRGLYEDGRTTQFNAPTGLLNLGGPAAGSNASGNSNTMSAELRRQMYAGVLTGVRYVMISRMARPEEVLIVENDEGEIVREFIKETDTITLYKTQRECLIYLTHLDPKDMENIMVEKLGRQMDGSEWSWANLNKLCWAIGSISGSMSEDQERRVLVIIIKDLLSLCELKRGKDNKAVVASNIMYVVGQYPRFLKAHWKFLKTVANKLFEFMHELHEGVRDMACDTFVTIAQKCRRHFIAQQPGEPTPFVEEIISMANTITSDLEPHQVNRFCEAIGYLISAQLNSATQEQLIVGLMKPANDMWANLVQQAGENINVLEDLKVVKQLGNILRNNVSACSAVGKGFISQIGHIYIDMLGLYKAVSEIISGCVARDGEIATRYANVRAMRTIKKEALLVVDTYVKHCDGEIAAVNENMVPPLLEAVLADYAQNVPPARDAEVLKTVNTITSVLGGLMTDKIPIIFDSLFESTMSMINQDFTEYPEHRLAIYQLLRTINKNCFSAMLNLPPQQFRFMVMSIMWGFKHTLRDIADLAKSEYQDVDDVLEEREKRSDIKQRILMVASRGVTFRQRHLMNDLEVLLPHSKKESKVEAKQDIDLLNELAEIQNCNNVFYFEARKHQDLYLWIARAPSGPSVKFHVQNIHTMDELKMTGNCLRGSRPVLSFDSNFDSEPHLQLLKEIFTQTFGVPKGARKSKPFFDHVFTFSVVDGRIWFRNFQIVEKDAQTGGDMAKNAKPTLVEIGPRFVLNTIRIFEGSFGGPTLYENPRYISPNVVRAAVRSQKATKYASRVADTQDREARARANPLPSDPLQDVFE